MRGEPPVIELLYRRYIAISKDNGSPCSAFEQKDKGSALGGGMEGGSGLRNPNIEEKFHSESLNLMEKERFKTCSLSFIVPSLLGLLPFITLAILYAV